MATAWRPVQTRTMTTVTMMNAPPTAMNQSRSERLRSADRRTDQCYPLRDETPDLRRRWRGRSDHSACGPVNAESRGGFSYPDTAADRRRPARGRRVLGAGWQEARLSERARAWQPVLPDLFARHDDRRYDTHLARIREDDLFILQAGHQRDRVRVDASRSEVEAVSEGRARLPRLGQDAALLVGLRSGVRDLLVQAGCEWRCADLHASHERARLRRGRQLLA